ncbi:MAG: SpoIVB peptidase [Defluviitaleaceae bacterium]|nr:SpoIVB peptidase [Defluviitaleaceae bacterium]
MKNLAANPRRFFIFALTILIAALFIHLFFNIREYIRFQSYPYQEIFYEDAITANQDSAEELSRRLGNSTKETHIVPVGITVGVRFYTDGIMILSTDKVMGENGSQPSPSDGKLLPGDVLVKADGTTMYNLPQLAQAINSAKDSINLEVLRDGTTHNIEITPVKSADDGNRKIGCWARDSTQGIGTITYYDPATGRFGALGHGICDVDTQKLMPVRHGQLMESRIIDVRKGKKGAPGELIGEIRERSIIGTVRKNTSLGLYGDINKSYEHLPTTTYAAARHDQIHQGPAKILSNIEGDGIKPYDVYIESINQDTGADKGMVVRITDQGLIARSGGIVQGMSGSPIMQGDKIVGAVTHVFVQNPLRGYGVFIEKMMTQEKAA